MQIELLKDNAIEFRGKFCYMWLMVLKPIYKQFIESCICPMLYRKSDVTLLYGMDYRVNTTIIWILQILNANRINDLDLWNLLKKTPQFIIVTEK